MSAQTTSQDDLAYLALLSMQIPVQVVLEPPLRALRCFSEKAIETALWQPLDLGLSFLKSEVTPVSLP